MIAELRTALVADLVTGSGGNASPIGVPVKEAWPSKVLNPPVVYVVPPQDRPYVTAGPNFGQWTVAVDLVILSGRADAADALAELEQLVEIALANTVDWTLAGGVDSPSTITVNGTECLGTTLHLSKPASL